MRHAIASLLALAACGGSPGGGPDASSPDASTDVRVKVTLFDDLGIPAKMPIVFSNPDGSIAAEVTSDDQGNAHAPLPQGGYVTAAWTRTSFNFPNETAQLVTMAVHAGDYADLSWWHDQPAGCTPYTGSTVTVPTYTGAASYRLFDPAEELDLGGGTTAHVAFSSCASGDLVAVAYDASGAPIGWSETSFDINSPPAAVTMPAFAAVGAYHVELAHGDVAGASFVVSRVPLALGKSQTPAAAPTIALDFPAIDAKWGNLHLNTKVTTASGVALVSDLIKPGDTSYAIDLATDLPPATVSATYANRAIAIATTGSFTPKFVHAGWSGTSSDAAPTEWHVLVPPGTATIQVPVLPSDLAGYDLAASGAPTVTLVDASTGLFGWDVDHAVLGHDAAQLLRGGFAAQRVRTLSTP